VFVREENLEPETGQPQSQDRSKNGLELILASEGEACNALARSSIETWISQGSDFAVALEPEMLLEVQWLRLWFTRCSCRKVRSCPTHPQCYD
jgi:hypothetical protein